ncbi:MAG: DUF2029 domain-containing protein [Actinobacteria bacterium]|nr:DUF2029 domain-containing protein [Actinomycetota bacterium]
MTRHRVMLVALVALCVAVWLGPLQHGIYSYPGISDLPVYERAAGFMNDGLVPYRDFALEYPPLAAGLFWLASHLPGSFATAFSGLMLAFLLVTLVAVVATARALSLSRARVLAAGVVVAIVPLLLGNMVETRYDLALAAALAGVVWAIVTERFNTAWALLAIAVLVKLVPLVLIPVLAIIHLRHAGPRRAAIGAIVGAAIVAAVVVPFVLMSANGTWGLVRYHLDRPLQIESLGGAYLLGLHALVGIRIAVTTSFGSQGFVTSGASTIAAISTTLLVLTLVAIAFTVFRLSRRPRVDLAALGVSGVAASVVALLVFGKVLSPQFLIWLLPVTLVVTGRFGIHAAVMTAVAMLLTLSYFPHQYWDLVALRPGPIALVVVRDAVLVALLAAVWPRGPGGAIRGRMLQPERPGVAADAPDHAVPGRYLID